MTMTEILVDQVADRIDLDSEPKHRFELVYVDYRDGFDPAAVEKLLRDGTDDYTDEWISQSAWETACDLADELFKEACDPDHEEDYDDLEAEWQASEARQELIFAIEERDTSDPYRDLLRNTGHMLFRVSPTEDDMAWLDADTLNGPAAGVCNALGLPLIWVEAVDEILPEIAGYAWEGGGYFGATFVFSADPADLYGHSEDALVEVDAPFLWLTNPWSGNGYGVVVKGRYVTLRMGDIHTDKAAWGYGADDVFGGLCLDDSTITVKED
jgi:hypothetical protein